MFRTQCWRETSNNPIWKRVLPTATGAGLAALANLYFLSARQFLDRMQKPIIQMVITTCMKIQQFEIVSIPSVEMMLSAQEEIGRHEVWLLLKYRSSSLSYDARLTSLNQTVQHKQLLIPLDERKLQCWRERINRINSSNSTRAGFQ